MALKDINPTLFSVAAEGIAQRGQGRIDTLQLYFLTMLARRARQLADEFWTKVTEQEVVYLNEIILTCYKLAVIDADHLFTHALGMGQRQRTAQQIPILSSSAPANGAFVDDSLAQGLKRTMMSTGAGDHARDSGGVTSESPIDAAVTELCAYMVAVYERNNFAAQKALRKFEKTVGPFNPRVVAYIKVAAVNKMLGQFGDILPSNDVLINQPGKDDTERLRHFIGHIKTLSKVLKLQTQAIDESLNILPDPDVLMKRRV